MRVPSSCQRRGPVWIFLIERGIRVMVILRRLLLLYRVETVVFGIIAVGTLLELLVNLLRVLINVNSYSALLRFLTIFRINRHPVCHNVLRWQR